MSSLASFDAIETRLKDYWTATPLVFENEPWQLADEPAAFVYVEIFGDRYPQESIGDPGRNQFREEGAAYLHVMVPDDTGTRAARSHADALSFLFREQNIAGLAIDDMAIGNGAPGRDFPNYWAMTVTLWWHRRDITSITL